MALNLVLIRRKNSEFYYQNSLKGHQSCARQGSRTIHPVVERVFVNHLLYLRWVPTIQRPTMKTKRETLTKLFIPENRSPKKGNILKPKHFSTDFYLPKQDPRHLCIRKSFARKRWGSSNRPPCNSLALLRPSHIGLHQDSNIFLQKWSSFHFLLLR